VLPFDPVTRVPLILRGPGIGAAGKVVAQPVSAVDVAPTLLALSGLPVPPEMEGKRLPGLGLGGERQPRDPVYVQCGDNLAIRVGDRKLLTQRQGGGDLVFDLTTDAAEQKNILGRDSAADRMLRDLAAKYWTTATAETRLILERQKSVDDSTRERLRALGYIE
jgi:arylsulfatase A-like enzyme